MRRSSEIAFLTCALPLAVALSASAAGGTPSFPTIEPCSSEVEWSENRQAAERQIESGDGFRIAMMPDVSLVDAVKQWWRARLLRDITGLLSLEIEQSDKHLEIEARYLKSMFESDKRNHFDTWRITPYSYWVDESNSAHVWVYSTVVARLHGRCVEDGSVTEWIRLQDQWYTFPLDGPSLRPIRKGRPNWYESR